MENYVIDLLLEELENYEDVEVYASELAYTLLESYNMDGSITYNTYEAKEWIKENYDDIYDYTEEISFKFGEETKNKIYFEALENPEKFMVIICIEKAIEILGQFITIDKNWDDKILLDKKMIETLKKELEEAKEN